jgi:hypothetical protein
MWEQVATIRNCQAESQVVTLHLVKMKSAQNEAPRLASQGFGVPTGLVVRALSCVG